MSDPTDPVAGVVAFLKADSAVAARCGTRVFGGELPEAENVSMPRTCVIVSPSGGGTIGRAYQNYGDFRVDFICYGATMHEAWLVWLEVRTAMKQMVAGVYASVLLHWARESAGGHLGRDPETQWPAALGSFQVLAAEVAAS